MSTMALSAAPNASAPAAPHAARSDRPVVVAVQSLTKVFKDFWMRPRARAVDNVSFHVEAGEVFGLLGPNGSGKSTTIKIMLGLLQPTSGRVAVFGRPPSDVAIKSRIGYLPEESYLYPFLNARETLDYYAKLFQLERRVRHRRIDELLDMVGLSAVQHRQIREYSKGMQRRIGIAQALINDPDFLILDEPTTGLDPIGTRQIKDLIIELGRRGKSILLSSHLLADVEDCVHRMVILYGGQIQREGSCDSLLSASSGALIQTDELDDDTINQIDRLIRERSRGERSILKVSRPRQSLENLFMRIVEEAQARKLATSGAQHGGQTAGFLRAPEGQGDALIQSLLAPEAPPPAAASAPAQSPPPSNQPDEGLIGSLLTDKAPAAPTARPAAAPQAPQEVDLGVIGDLLSDSAKPAPSDPRTPGDKA